MIVCCFENEHIVWYIEENSLATWNLWINEIYGVMQSETEQRPHKVSFYVDKDKAQDVTKALSEIFAKRGVSFKFFQEWVALEYHLSLP